jgi:hypothetical protein
MFCELACMMFCYTMLPLNYMQPEAERLCLHAACNWQCIFLQQQLGLAQRLSRKVVLSILQAASAT